MLVDDALTFTQTPESDRDEMLLELSGELFFSTEGIEEGSAEEEEIDSQLLLEKSEVELVFNWSESTC
jgi:hypothetical protein